MPTDRENRQRVRDLENLCGCAAADLSWLVGFARGVDSERDPAYLAPLQRRIDQLLHAAAGKPIDGKVIAPWPQDDRKSDGEAETLAAELGGKIGSQLGGKLVFEGGRIVFEEGAAAWECADCDATSVATSEDAAVIALCQHRWQHHGTPAGEASGADSTPVVNAEELAERLGGKLGGTVRGGNWDCADCEEGGFADGDFDNAGALALYRHRLQSHDGPT